MKQKTIYQRASLPNRIGAALVDGAFSLIFIYIFLRLTTDFEMLSLRFLLEKNFILPWKIFFGIFFVATLPHVLCLYLVSQSLGQIFFRLKVYSVKNKSMNLDITQSLLKTLLSTLNFFLFLGSLSLCFFLNKKQKSLSEHLTGTLVFQRKKRNSEETSKTQRIILIFLFLWLFPSSLLLMRKISFIMNFDYQGLELYPLTQGEKILEVKRRALEKPLRKPDNFDDFFNELRWSILWKDYERHLLLMTETSKILVSLNYDLYKKSLPRDINFSHVERTERKNLYKLYYYAIEKKKKTDTLEFFYLTRENERWVLDHSKLFLDYYFGKKTS